MIGITISAKFRIVNSFKIDVHNILESSNGQCKFEMEVVIFIFDNGPFVTCKKLKTNDFPARVVHTSIEGPS